MHSSFTTTIHNGCVFVGYEQATDNQVWILKHPSKGPADPITGRTPGAIRCYINPNLDRRTKGRAPLSGGQQNLVLHEDISTYLQSNSLRLVESQVSRLEFIIQEVIDGNIQSREYTGEQEMLHEYWKTQQGESAILDENHPTLRKLRRDCGEVETTKQPFTRSPAPSPPSASERRRGRPEDDVDGPGGKRFRAELSDSTDGYQRFKAEEMPGKSEKASKTGWVGARSGMDVHIQSNDDEDNEAERSDDSGFSEDLFGNADSENEGKYGKGKGSQSSISGNDSETTNRDSGERSNEDTSSVSHARRSAENLRSAEVDTPYNNLPETVDLYHEETMMLGILRGMGLTLEAELLKKWHKEDPTASGPKICGRGDPKGAAGLAKLSEKDQVDVELWFRIMEMRKEFSSEEMIRMSRELSWSEIWGKMRGSRQNGVDEEERRGEQIGDQASGSWPSTAFSWMCFSSKAPESERRA